jgi:NADP-dependent 3-hydroxy acid dehydrogenase YdfG
MNQALSGKTAIVTGASSGIGQAVTFNLAQSGAAVVLHARRRERLDQLVSQITAKGGKALAVAGDVTVPADLDSLMDQALNWEDGGRKVDIVVVNAGRGLAGGLLDSDESQWRQVYETNVLGAAHLLRIAAKYMDRRKMGDIVAIGSVVGRHISPISGLYGSTKFALAGIVEGLRREVCQNGVRVSLVMPGIVVSEFQGVAGYSEDNFGQLIAKFGKLLDPKDIADGICWLLTMPPHVNVNEIMIRPTGQTYP